MSDTAPEQVLAEVRRVLVDNAAFINPCGCEDAEEGGHEMTFGANPYEAVDYLRRSAGL